MKYQIINPETIEKSMLHNESMIQEFISLYLTQCPVDFQTLAESIEKKDTKAISSAAHHIKPTMAYIGASDLREKLQELEDSANQQDSISSLIEKHKEIESLYTKLITELEFYQSNS